MPTAVPVIETPKVELRRLPLPEPRDPTLAFYAVKLKGMRGFIPALCTEGNEVTIVRNPDDPYHPLPFRSASNEQEAKQMENRRMIYVEDANGRPLRVQARIWKNANPNYKNRRYSEDPRVAATTKHDPVVAVTLWCPALGQGQAGATEEHGPYAGVNPDDTESGVCPKCAGVKEQERPRTYAIARKRIWEHFAACGATPSDALAQRVVLENVR